MPLKFRHISYLMTALFVFAVIVQYNDPDPLQWMSMYGAAAALSWYAARRGSVSPIPVVALGAVALVWGIMQATDVPNLEVFTHMFDAWEMRSVPIEEAREASGLWIVAAWMAVLAIRGRRKSVR